MSTFKKINDEMVIRVEDLSLFGVSDAGYIAWCAEGNTPEPADIRPVVIPQTVTRFQALAALHLAGYLEAASAAVAQSGVMAKLAWDNAQSFERSSQTLVALAVALGLSEAQLDALFTQADQIKA